MEMNAVSALPIVSVKMVVAGMRPDERGLIAVYELTGGHDTFLFCVPRRVAKQLLVGDEVTVVCVLSENTKYASTTLCVKVTRQRSISEIYNPLKLSYFTVGT